MIRLGIIGAGRIGKVHCESIGRYVKDAVVACVADPFMNDETEKIVRSFGAQKVCKDYREILDDKTIDAVLICSSTDTHAKFRSRRSKRANTFFAKNPSITTSPR